MKLYQSHYSPNSRRVRILLAEKGIQVPMVEVDISRGESHTLQFLQLNPLGQVPVLELDNGSLIADSVAICRYFEQLYTPRVSLGATGVLELRELAAIETAAIYLHNGDYLLLTEKFLLAQRWVVSNGYELSGTMRFLYHRGPMHTTDPSEYLTEIQHEIHVRDDTGQG